MSTESPNNSPPSDNQGNPQTDSPLEYWGAWVAGILIASGIFALGNDQLTGYLVWVPAALMIGWILVKVIFKPRPRKERVFKEPAIVAKPQTAPKTEAAPQPVAAQAAAPAEQAAPEPSKAAAAKPTPSSLEGLDVVILWGSESGNAEGLAEMAETKLKAAGMKAAAAGLDAVKLGNLPAFRNILIITSTWGDGEPPSNAIDMWEAFQKETVDLSKTGFSVMSLGDTAYPQFCKCGQDFDQFLAQQGAKRIHPRTDADLDFEAPFEKWITGVTTALQGQLATA